MNTPDPTNRTYIQIIIEVLSIIDFVFIKKKKIIADPRGCNAPSCPLMPSDPQSSFPKPSSRRQEYRVRSCTVLSHNLSNVVVYNELNRREPRNRY